MPKPERLHWLAPLAEGRGVTLSADPAADLYLAEDPNALLLAVLYDSQYATRQAFTVPLRLRTRLGHLDPVLLAAEDTEPLVTVFCTKPALHRFPRKFAQQTQKLCAVLVSEYGGNAARIWIEAGDVPALEARLMALPAFGREKTNWTVGMLGRLGMLPYSGWESYIPPPEEAPA